MSESLEFAELRGRIVQQRRRIHNRFRADSERWPLGDGDRAELEAIDSLLADIEQASREVQARLTPPE